MQALPINEKFLHYSNLQGTKYLPIDYFQIVLFLNFTTAECPNLRYNWAWPTLGV